MSPAGTCPGTAASLSREAPALRTIRGLPESQARCLAAVAGDIRPRPGGVAVTRRLIPSDRRLGEGLRTAVVGAGGIARGFGAFLDLGPDALAAGRPGRDGEGD